LPRAWFKHIHICMSQLGKYGKIKWFEIWQTLEIDELLKINMVTCMLTQLELFHMFNTYINQY